MAVEHERFTQSGYELLIELDPTQAAEVVRAADEIAGDDMTARAEAIQLMGDFAVALMRDQEMQIGPYIDAIYEAELATQIDAIYERDTAW